MIRLAAVVARDGDAQIGAVVQIVPVFGLSRGVGEGLATHSLAGGSDWYSRGTDFHERADV